VRHQWQLNSGSLAVYHYYPPVEQVREWIDPAGLTIAEEGLGSGWQHFLTSKKSEYIGYYFDKRNSSKNMPHIKLIIFH
jgi:hypothetical protein